MAYRLESDGGKTYLCLDHLPGDEEEEEYPGSLPLPEPRPVHSGKPRAH